MCYPEGPVGPSRRLPARALPSPLRPGSQSYLLTGKGPWASSLGGWAWQDEVCEQPTPLSRMQSQRPTRQPKGEIASHSASKGLQSEASFHPHSPAWQLSWAGWHALVSPEGAALACRYIELKTIKAQQTQEEVSVSAFPA